MMSHSIQVKILSQLSSIKTCTSASTATFFPEGLFVGSCASKQGRTYFPAPQGARVRKGGRVSRSGFGYICLKVQFHDGKKAVDGPSQTRIFYKGLQVGNAVRDGDPIRNRSWMSLGILFDFSVSTDCSYGGYPRDGIFTPGSP
jgi:hypothetical protein